MIGAPSRPVIVYTPRPVDEARAILAALLAGPVRVARPGSTAGVKLVDGVVDTSRVSFRVARVGGDPAIGGWREAPPLEFDGMLGETPDGSVLRGSITAPTTLGWPAAGLTVLVALFLVWNHIPPVLVAVGVAAWIFLTVIVISSLGEQRLRDAEPIQRLLEDALA